MANTGAPWSLPYPLPSDLVRDGADAIKLLAEAVADGLDDAAIVRQVVLATDTTERSTSSGTYQDAGISVSITPKSATSRIYVIYSGYSNVRRFAQTIRTGDLQIVDASNDTLTGAQQVTADEAFSPGADRAITFIATALSSVTDERTYKLRFRIRNPGEGGTISLLNATSTGLLIAMEVE